MPRCFVCKKIDVPPEEMWTAGSELVCGTCAEVLGLINETCCGSCSKPVLEVIKSPEMKAEEVMEKEKPVFGMEITPDPSKENYLVTGFLRMGGVKMEFDTDVEKIRAFFTRRRENQEKRAHLRTAR